MSGMKTFITIGSIPIYLLKFDLPIRAMFFTRSERISGNLRSLFIRFLRIWINKVGIEELLVMSWFGSSDLPLVRMLAKTLRAAARACRLSFYFKSEGVI
jgi:pilus assembly protein TadC